MKRIFTALFLVASFVGFSQGKVTIRPATQPVFSDTSWLKPGPNGYDSFFVRKNGQPIFRFLVIGTMPSYGNITGKPSLFTPAPHAHDIADVASLQTILDSKQPAGNYITGTGTVSGNNTGDNAVNSLYENDYRASNFIAGTNYLQPSGNGSSLTGLTKSQVGLSNVDNTSDLNKPISTLTQAALDGKQPAGNYAAASHTHAAADITETTTKRFVTDAEKSTWNSKQDLLVSGTNIKTVNGQSLLGSGDVIIAANGSPVLLNLSSAFSSIVITPANVTGWSFNVTTGKTYRIEVIADYQTAATTTGGILGIALSGGATGSVRGYAAGAISQSAVATELAIPIRTTSGAGSSLTTTGVSVINSPHFFTMVITFTCTASGTFNVQWATEVAASAAQLNANSSLIYQVLN